MINVTAAPANVRTWPAVLAISALLLLAMTFTLAGEPMAANAAAESGTNSLWERITSVGGIKWIR